MTPDRPSGLLDQVFGLFEQTHVRFALIGAAALAIHGVGRSTLDVDILVTDRRVLEPSLWLSLPRSVSVDIRPGDASDPLAGVVRLSDTGERDVDVVVGRSGWNDDVLSRAVVMSHSARMIPVATADDLVLLKLYAGGRQDLWDIEQLLAGADADLVAAEVDRHVAALPKPARDIWAALRPR